LIKTRLTKLRKSQAKAAKEIGVGNMTMSRYYNGKSLPRKDKIPLIANSLDVDVKILEEILNYKS